MALKHNKAGIFNQRLQYLYSITQRLQYLYSITDIPRITCSETTKYDEYFSASVARHVSENKEFTVRITWFKTPVL